MTRFISFNVNGVRARPHQLEAVRDQLAPDVMGLQEIKVDDPQFPVEMFTELGWHVEYFGQKSHYGVALVSLVPPVKVQKGFPWDEADAQRRFIHCQYEINGHSVDVLNGYFPQGDSDKHETKFPAKKQYYADLTRYLKEDLAEANNIVLMGDMNISPQDQDIGIGEQNAKRWLKSGKCSFLPVEREWYQTLLATGLSDAYRLHYPEQATEFSWFDYRSKGFDDEPKRGLRIDHILLSQNLLSGCADSGISYDIRAMEKPSDHAPIWADVDFKA